MTSGELLDSITGWRGASPSVRAQLLRGLCGGVRLRSLVTNALTLCILAALIIAQTRNWVHILWVAAVIGAGFMPRIYAARLRRENDFEQDTERKALTMLAISAVYGLIWGLGAWLILPDVRGASEGILLFILVFGTIMGPYAPMPGILYVRLATTGLTTLGAVACYSSWQVFAACVVVSLWLVVRTDIWRGYHRSLRRQLELQETLERRHQTLASAHQSGQAANRELRKLAQTDPLTSAYNRRALMRRFEQLPENGAVVVMDIDHFKRINDEFGHHAGDEALIKLVALIQENLRKQDMLARTGGEEFVMLLVDTDSEHAMKIAERIREQAANMVVRVGSGNISLTVSIGVAMISPGIGTQSSLSPYQPSYDQPSQDQPAYYYLRQADSALYRAKRNGRNRVELAGPQDAASSPMA